MSSIFKKRRLTASVANTGPSPPKKQRLIDAAKMLLDIGKESADVFPPLKSCLGGISALIKHYEECKDVEDKLGDLIPWLNKLRSLTTDRPDDNREDTGRREQLAGFLDDIEKQSLVLLEKGKTARLLDKKQDSGVVVELVEKLRQAILIYQLSQQRSIDNQVAQLASSFSAFLKLREKPQGVKGKIESILKRLGRLDVDGSIVGDQGESKRRTILFEALEGIKDELLPILERSSAVGYEENDTDMHAVCELAESVRDAIMEYQFAQQKAIYGQNSRLVGSDERTALNSYRRARGAGYQHGDRNGCLKGTRESILEEIERWIEDSEKSPVFWLNGLAGTGKTTIAQTTAERAFAQGRLGASFFCSRDFEDRSDLRFIFPTLAFQLAYKYPDFRSHFVSLLQVDPDVVYESLYNQMQKLIAEPLQAAGVSTVIVIDALDECKDDEPSSAILSVLGRFVGQLHGTKFFITGRPEPRIRTGFRLPLLIDSTDVFVLHNVHPSLVNSDIRLFLKHELTELAQRRQLKKWPTEENVDVLCHRAAGLFVYAVATVKFLASNTHLPKHRLDVILKLPECTAPEGKTRFKPNTTLDSLYTSILQTAFNEDEDDDDVDFKLQAIIGTIVAVVNPLPPSAIAELIGVEPEEVLLFLTLIQSLLAVGEDSSQPVKPFHKSFPDFITDPSRCTNARFFISPGHIHLEVSVNCLRTMNDGLAQNFLSLPEYALNSEVRDLQTRINDHISITLQYACRSWHRHLTKTKGDTADVISCLSIFLEEKFLAWLEVLSVLGDVGGAVVGLENLIDWLQKFSKYHKLLNIATDYFYFVTKFFEPISASATHIYHSALELCPTSSVIRKLYYDRASRVTCLPRVVVGTPDSWDRTTSISGKDDYKSCAWSPCGRFVATLRGNTVEIQNQLTFELVTALQPMETTTRLTGPLAYSPDQRSLACSSNTTIVVWDIQTGGVTKEIVCGGMKTISLAWSLDGNEIGTLEYLPPGTRHAGTYLYTYHIRSGTALFIETIHSSHEPHLWAHAESFRATSMERYPLDDATIEIEIEIFEVPSLLSIRTFSFTTKAQTGGPDTDDTAESEVVSFSPTTWHVSVLVDYKLFIFGDQDSVPLLQAKGCFLTPCFSPDGSLFAASKEKNVYIWEFASDSYSQWKMFGCQDVIDSLRFSPTSSSFLSHSRNILQMSRLDDLPALPKPRYRQYAALSRSGTRIAIAHKLQSTITIIDPHSRSPSQLINTGGQIRGLLFTNNVLSVVDLNLVMAWRLTEKGLVDGVVDGRIPDRSDCIWALPLSNFRGKLKFRVDGQFGVIEGCENGPLLYHTETGTSRFCNLLDPGGSWHNPRNELCGRHYLRLNDLPQHNYPPEDGWHPSETTLREGWVQDFKGRHRLWLYVEWRIPLAWDHADWRYDITTQFSIVGGQPLIIKF